MPTSASLWLAIALQMAQNPSPMTEDTRAHTRLTQQQSIRGARSDKRVTAGRPKAKDPLILHFHGAQWVAEQAATSAYRNVIITAMQHGAGSGAYEKPYTDAAAFAALIQGETRPIILTGWSAGYGAIRAILRHSADRISGVILMDGLHAGYTGDRKPQPDDLQPFLDFARRAANGEKRMLITHSEVFPGTFASTSETASYLIGQLQLKRRPVLRWGPIGMQQISEARRGRLAILGFAGNSAPDHVDHYHAMSAWLRILRKL